MIYVEMRGRAGNQFFRYAFARWMMLQTGDSDLTFSFNEVQEMAKKKPKSGFVDYLADFRTVPYKVYPKSGKLFHNETDFFQKILVVIYKYARRKKGRTSRNNYEQKYQKYLNFFGIYWAYDKVEIKAHKRRKQLVNGNFEWEGFFAPIRETLLQELRPKEPLPPGNFSMMKTISGSNAVCVSVRRGDFLAAEHVKSFGVCTQKYYLEALDLMFEKVKEPRFFVFSDDIEWCKKEIVPTVESPVTYVPQKMPVYETLRLMYSCKHFILSNSTFSWWGQYLSKSPDKVVISPSRWNNEGFDSPLIGKDWILIDP